MSLAAPVECSQSRGLLVPLRILFCALNYYPVPAGGAERQARLQAEELARRGHEVTVVCPSLDGRGSETINDVYVLRLRIIDRRPFRRLSHMLRLAVWIGRHVGAFDLVHVHLANLQADVAVAAARLQRKPTYLKVACGGRAGEIRKHARVAPVTRWYGLRHASRVQALSDEIEAELESIGISRTITRIPNGVDLHVFRPALPEERTALRRALGLPLDRTLALFAGRFARYKGVLDLLEAWNRVGTDRATLVLVGGARTEDGIGSVASSEDILVRPYTNDISTYLRAADIFVYPSYADGMSNALLEAMACGLAPIATHSGATDSLIQDGATGLLFEAGDVSRLVAALDRLIRDENLRRRIGGRAAERASSFAITSVVDRIEDVYRELLTR